MFDIHVHSAPDVTHRLADDTTIGQHYAQHGFNGFVLKSHHESTVGRAASLSRSSHLDVVGGVALNWTAGGINSHAVLAALLSGGRMIWFPTADSPTQEQARLPRLSDHDDRLTRRTIALPPVTSLTESQSHELTVVLDLVAEFDAVLCTGHISTAECKWLFDEAQRRGIRRFLLTHPSYTVPDMGLADIAEFAERGAFVEVTAFQLWHQPGMTSARLAAVAEAAGAQLILASDAGQTDTPEPPVALEKLISKLATHGADEALLHAAADETPRGLVLP